MHPSLPVSSNPTSASTPVLQALGAVVDYGERTILQGLDLAVNAGEIYALLGANGAGKTTTLSMLLGFVRPRSGQVRVQGVDPVTAPAQADRKSTRLNSSHTVISYAVFCLKKKKNKRIR